VLEVLQVLGRGDSAGVEPLLIADGALTDQVDILLGLGLLSGGVALLGLGGDQQVPQLGDVGAEPLELGVLGEAPALVVQLPDARVEGLDFEETDLVGGLGVQRGAPGFGVEFVRSVGTACAVQGSVTARDT